MNYLTNIKNVVKLSQQDLHNPGKTSWHDQYKDSAWIYIGGLPFDLTEGDIICIFSQYGEVVNINLIREKDTGKSKGFCFLCYEDQRSTILAVDNLNGIKVLNRSIRVDHVQNYKVPKDDKKATNETKKLHAEGCAPTPKPATVPVAMKKEIPDQGYFRETLVDQIEGEIKLPARLPIYVKQEKASDDENVKKEKKQKKNKKKKSKKDASSSDSEDDRRSRKRRETSKDRNKKKRNERRDSSEEKVKRRKYEKEDKDNSKRRERSNSKEKDETTKTFRREVLPNIPKRWQ
ncbi:unnamed protein product [Ceutorhynchus assimilis]|uniref:RRM domain-containing protein n=1 Tax=Ceutorhynchus assimilis TaxID=467358 RepID=A0A9P0GPL4_9CUCU|nr:unnamed protein product [Ceutorhynchus assimilis]